MGTHWLTGITLIFLLGTPVFTFGEDQPPPKGETKPSQPAGDKSSIDPESKEKKPLTPEEIKKAAQTLIEEWLKHYTDGEQDKPLAAFAKKPEPIAIASTGQVLTGIKALKTHYEEFYKSFKFNKPFKIKQKRMVVDENMAWFLGLVQSEGTLQNEDAPRFIFRAHISLILQRIDGEWAIIGMDISPLSGSRTIEILPSRKKRRK